MIKQPNILEKKHFKNTDLTGVLFGYQSEYYYEDLKAASKTDTPPGLILGVLPGHRMQN